MAEEVTKFVHGENELNNAIETTNKLFANQSTPAEILTIEDLEGMEGIVKITFEISKINEGIDVVSFLADTNIFPSKGEAKKMLQNGGVQINRNKVEEMQMKVDSSMLLHNKYLLVQKGKKNYFLVEIK